MALPINIDDLIQRRVVENARVEYKCDWNPEPILHTICAFANDIDNWGGGYLIIGMEEENGMPKYPVTGLGQHSLDRIQKELLQLCNAIEPRYLPIVQPYVYENRQLLILWAPGGYSRPYRCPISYPVTKDSRGHKAYYIRKMSSSIRANQLEEKELFLLADNQPFDDRPNLHSELADLKSSLISEFLHGIGSGLYQESLQQPVASIAESMHLLVVLEMRKPLNVGLMFFNDTPERFFPYTRIEVVDKPDPTGEGMTEKIFVGPLDRQLRDALSYIRNYIIKETISKRADRAEADRAFNYPYAAVEEALSNAVYHKSYQISEPVTVTVTPDKMEITSLPGPDRTIRDEDLRECRLVSKRYRNRRIGDFLKELKLVEGRNTGVPTMLKAMSRNGSKPPVFETDAARSYLTVILPAKQGEPMSKARNITTGETRKRRNRAEIKKLIVQQLSDHGNMAARELASALGYAKLNASMSSVIQDMLIDGSLSYLYPDKPRSRNQKLCLIKSE